STAGKIELEYAGEDKKEEDLVDRLINRAVLAVWDRFLSVEALGRVVAHFEAGWGVEGSDRVPAAGDREGGRKIPGPRAAGGRAARAVREPRPHGGGDRAGARGASPAPALEQGPRRGPLGLSLLMLVVRYTAWDGTQQVRLTAEQVFDKLSEYLSYTDDVQQAPQRLPHQGL